MGDIDSAWGVEAASQRGDAATEAKRVGAGSAIEQSLPTFIGLCLAFLLTWPKPRWRPTCPHLPLVPPDFSKALSTVREGREIKRMD